MIEKIITKNLSSYRIQVGGSFVYFSHEEKINDLDRVDLHFRDIVLKIDEVIEKVNELGSISKTVATVTSDEMIKKVSALETELSAVNAKISELSQHTAKYGEVKEPDIKADEGKETSPDTVVIDKSSTAGNAPHNSTTAVKPETTDV